ncbi:fatty acid desaturase-domain-containing protein [Lipomyces oligophaga]|uniref:fatty acid desaturase-domain-containing protein n=1 Tax=Lipomyces oligophaga TaxID=45792 RepID=UPI0034CE7868
MAATGPDLFSGYTVRPFYLPVKPKQQQIVSRVSLYSDLSLTSLSEELSHSDASDTASDSENLKSSGSSVSSFDDAEPVKVEPKVDPTENFSATEIAQQSEFFWTYQEEPHRTRRMQIIKAHPEVTKLCGHEPLTKYVITGVVCLQVLCAYLLRNSSFFSLQFLLTVYIIGATANQNVFLCIHELSHNLGFKKPIHNRLFAIFANLPIGIPYGASFRPYHLIHHKHLGDVSLDTDLPTSLEALVLQNVAGKAFFATFQIFFYAIRPMCVMAMPFTYIHFLNILGQVMFDVAIVKLWGIKPLLYFIASSFFAGSLHPLAGHFIAEHYVLKPDLVKSEDSSIPPPETYSYYGILNLFTYNVGLHNEHHDFPFIPWTRLPLLTQIASEFYEPLPYHESWTRVIWDFIFDKKVSLWCRVKRGGESGTGRLKDLSAAKMVNANDNGDEEGERKDK